MDSALTAFAGISLLLTITPGADTALIIRSTLAGGRTAGLMAALGVGSGLWFHALLSALGLSALLAHSAQAYETVKYLGAAYLLYLGIKALLEKPQTQPGADGNAAPVPHLTPLRAYTQGLLTNILNPKVALFYLTFLPQFMRPGDAVLERSLLLAGIHFSWGMLWAVVIVLMMERFQLFLSRPNIKRGMNRLTGAVMVGFGVKVFLD